MFIFIKLFFQKYSKSVQIASKLVTRITKLPYMANPMSVSYQVRRWKFENENPFENQNPHTLHKMIFDFFFQTYKVKTEVFPSEMGEESIPWWVWLVAALLGLLLLTIIVICLKKVMFLVTNRVPENWVSGSRSVTKRSFNVHSWLESEKKNEPSKAKIKIFDFFFG